MFSHAAFSRDDIDDSKRGYPAVDLTPYAQARGWVQQGSQLAGHFRGLNPLFAEYTFNTLRGELVPGRFGVLQHELWEEELDAEGSPHGGTFYAVRVGGKFSFNDLLPFSGLVSDGPTKPFEARSMWLPATSIRVQVPESAVMPMFTLMTAGFLPFTSRRLPTAAQSLRIAPNQWMTPDLEQLVAAEIGPPLEWLGAAFTRLRVANGAFALTVNGYAADPARLDQLVAAARAIADGLARICAPWALAAPFEHPLGPFDRSLHPGWFPSFGGEFDGGAMVALGQVAQNFGMVVEDPLTLHRRFPTLPIPGISRGVVAGRLPGSAAIGRLTWQHHHGPESGVAFRPAALFAAAPDAPPTPVGGHLLPSTDMYVAVRDGVAACWSRSVSFGRLDSEPLVARALASMRETGLAVV
jgi:hypothetical protein